MKILVKILFLCLLTNISLSQPSITWQRYYVSPFFYPENQGEDICKADGNNFYIIGYNNYPKMVQVIKINEFGDTLWQKFLDSNVAFSGTTSDNDGIIITGLTRPPYNCTFFLKYQKNGVLEWYKRYDAMFGETCYKIIKLPNIQYIACGNVNYNEGYIIKTDSIGNMIWQKNFTAGYYKLFYSITEAYGGGYVVTGYEVDYQFGTPHGTVTRLDTSGNIIWQKRYSLNDTGLAQIKSIDKINNSYILGSSRTNKACIVRIDTAGNFLSGNIYGDTQFAYNVYDVKAISPNKYIFSAEMFKSNPWTVDTRVYIIDSTGDIIRDKIFDHTSIFQLYRILPVNNGDIMFSGSCNFPNEVFTTILAVRTDSNLFSPIIGVLNNQEIYPKNFYLEQNYPNPFNSNTIIKFKIPENKLFRLQYVKLVVYDILGKEVEIIVKTILKPGVYKFSWNPNNYSTGIYFYSLYFDKHIETKKMILVK